MAEVKYLDLTGLQRYDQKIKEVVNIGLDAKIGKDDVILEGKSINKEETFSKETSLFGGESWEVLLNARAGYSGPDAILVDELGNEIMTVFYEYGGRFKFSLQNGVLSGAAYSDGMGDWATQTMDAPVGVENYKIVLSSETAGSTATIVATTTEKNTENSIVYLNEKLSGATQSLSNNKIGKTDNMLYVENAAIKESHVLNQNDTIDVYNDRYWKIEAVAQTGYPSYKLTDNTGQTIYELNGEGPYVNKLTLIHNNGELEIIENGDSGESRQTQSITSYYTYTLTLISNHSANVNVSTPKTGYLNTEESLNYLADAKTDKTEVESSLSLKADKTELDTKIGVDDGMLEVGVENNFVLNNGDTYDLTGDAWEITVSNRSKALSAGISLTNASGAVLFNDSIDGDYNFVLKDNVISVYRYDEFKSQYDTTDNYHSIQASGTIYLSKTDTTTLNTRESLEHLNSALSTKITAEDLPTTVSQLTNDAGYAVAGDLKIAEVTEGLGENVAKAYKFEGGAESAVIEIPKDQTLKSVELGKIVDEAFVVDPTGEILRFTYIIADGSESVVDVNISNLITEAELDPVYDLIDKKLDAADVLTVSNDEIDAMFA